MNPKQKEALRMMGGNHISFNVPMKPHTTFHVGGTADAFYEAEALDQLVEIVSYASKEKMPYFVLGKGSNTLIKDSGIRGLVIRLRGTLTEVDREPDEEELTVGAGLAISDLLIRCRDLELSGLEFMAGIPGTIGGAVAMNAGALGHEVSERVESIRLITPQGSVLEKERGDCVFFYRGLELEKGSIITHIRVRLAASSRKAISEKISNSLEWRKVNQPLNDYSAGSVFKNPHDNYAGRLIEAAGLKGKRVGGAMVSNRHANFIVNKENATATDILTLMSFIQREVKRQSGIELEPEIKVVGGMA